MWWQPAGFLSHYLSDPLPYVWGHITVNKMCWVRRYIKHFLSSFLIHRVISKSKMEFNDSDVLVGINISSPGYAYWTCVIVTASVGLVGNLLVSLLMRHPKLSTLSYPVYLKSLAASDSVMLTYFCATESLRLFEPRYSGGYGVGVCALTKFIQFFVMLLSPWLVVGLTLDRYCCVVFPLSRGRFCTPNKATIVCSSLTFASLAMAVPLLAGVKVEEKANSCFFKDHLIKYVTFIRLIFSSSLPCLLILVLNVVIGVHIRRGASFRRRFVASRKRSVITKQDNSLRPLMLISILAFVTLIPTSVNDCVFVIVYVTKFDTKALETTLELWSVFTILYLVNFAQNFYILMVSSANYRHMMMAQLKCRKDVARNEHFTMATV